MSNTFAFRMLHFKAIESSNPTANDTSSPRGIFNQLNLQQNDRAHENRKYEKGGSSSREQECVAAEHPPARCVQAAQAASPTTVRCFTLARAPPWECKRRVALVLPILQATSIRYLSKSHTANTTKLMPNPFRGALGSSEHFR